MANTHEPNGGATNRDDDLTRAGTSPGGGSTGAAETGGSGGVGGNLSGGPSVPPVEGTEAGIGGTGVGLDDLTGGGVKGGKSNTSGRTSVQGAPGADVNLDRLRDRRDNYPGQAVAPTASARPA